MKYKEALDMKIGKEFHDGRMMNYVTNLAQSQKVGYL